MKSRIACGWVILTAGLALAWSAAGAANYSAAIFLDRVPGQDQAMAPEMVPQVQQAGFTTEIIGLDILTNATQMTPARYRLLVLPSVRRLPAAATASLDAYLKAGGSLLALGAPAWNPGLFQVGDQWLSRAEYEALIGQQKPGRLLEDFERADLSAWRHGSNEKTNRTRWEVVPAAGGKALHVRVDAYTGWDNLGRSWNSPFPAGHTLTCFKAKGAPQTRQLSLEWGEADGSRWIATVDLTTNWTSFALPPEAFKAWQPPASRSKPGDQFNPRRAAGFMVGIAQSHTTLSGRQHEYWFDDLGTAPNPFGDAVPPGLVNAPHLETLSPSTLFYPISTSVRLRTPAESVFTSPVQWETPIPAGLFALHPRPQGAGYGQDRPWRWQPLLEVRADDGDYRGAVGVLMPHFSGRGAGSVRAAFTPDDPAFYRQPKIRALVNETLAAMHRGLFLKDGGSEFFTVFADQKFRLGATVANLSPEPHPATIKIRVRESGSNRVAFETQWQTNLAAGATVACEQSWQPASWPKNGFTVSVELWEADRLLDHLAHALNVWTPPARPVFMEATQGAFRLGGQPWKANGVNYMPGTGIAQPINEYFEHWIGKGGYDPELVQRELARIQKMNLNMVSVFIYYRSLQGGHLLDFLRRCETLGIKVNLSLRPGTPMEFRWDEMKALIQHYRLAQNDTVIAYDMAWEPSHFDHNFQQRNYQKPWEQWVLKQYGSRDKAQAAWQFVPTGQGALLEVPAVDQLFQDGAWRRMTADYRRFLDEWLESHYAEARRLVQSIDPHHPVSFRMQFAGDPTHTWSGLLPYDFFGLRRAVDIWEPEAYGRIGDWEKVKPGRFTADYARLCDPKKPVLWAEMGNHVWDMNTMAPSPEKLAFTAQYYRDFYRMMTESGADGIISWWYAGGFRLYENSDYGIINPDGTDREISRVIREDGARFLRAPKPAAPDYWISVDRARDARGLNGIYEAVKAEYWQAIANGKRPGLRWAKEPGNIEIRNPISKP
jgi:hypothetical protein